MRHKRKLHVDDEGALKIQSSVMARKIVGSQTDLQKAWRRFLQDSALLRETTKLRSLPGLLTAPPNPILNERLPTILFIQLCSFLHEALEEFHQKVYSSVALPDTFKKVIDNLSKDLVDTDACHDLRKKRNALAHDVGVHVNWPELDGAVDIVDAELRKLHAVGTKPSYDYYMERTLQDSSDTKVAVCFRYEEGLKLDGKTVLAFTWTQNVMKDDS